jgi:hypothetical protein
MKSSTLVLERVLAPLEAVPHVFLDGRRRRGPVPPNLSSFEPSPSREKRQMVLRESADGGRLGERDEFLAVQVAGRW